MSDPSILLMIVSLSLPVAAQKDRAAIVRGFPLLDQINVCTQKMILLAKS
jgi:hypothetical protein